MKKTKKNKQKLFLNKETVAHLTGSQMSSLHGGLIVQTDGCIVLLTADTCDGAQAMSITLTFTTCTDRKSTTDDTVDSCGC